MSEYMKLIARSGIRFSGGPVTLSPQLDDFGIQHLLYHVSSELGVAFRVILYVPNLESHEVKISCPSSSILEVRYKHGLRPMEKKHQQQKMSWSRDCKYLYRLPNNVSRDQLTASWTNDGFLVIQARGLESQTPPEESQLLLPTRVCAILRPFMDISLVIDSLRMHAHEIEAVIGYLEKKGLLSQEKDVLRLLVDYPGKPKITPKPSPQNTPQKVVEEL